jgi:hypothetical protein
MKRMDCFLDTMKKMILYQKISEAEAFKGILRTDRLAASLG